MEEGDALAQEEEREALRAIYGDDAVQWDPSLRVLTLSIGGGEEDEALLAAAGFGGDDDAGADAASAAGGPSSSLALRVLVPDDYPSRSPPVVEVVVVPAADPDDGAAAMATADLARRVDEACAAACRQEGEAGQEAEAGASSCLAPPLWSPGEVALFSLAEQAREIRREWLERELQEARRRREEREAAAQAAAETAKAQRHQEEEEQEEARRRQANNAPPALERDCDPADVDRMAALIVSGDPVVERKSAFQAHVAPVSSVGDVRAAVAALLRVSKIRNCTHNIMAYRIRRERDDGASATWLADCDDDGEDAAGGRLLQLLHSSGAEGVVVVVSRWFGGVLLGPSRFALINNTARALLVREGYIRQAGGGGAGEAGPGGSGGSRGKGR